jgi:hypothetical protein
MAVLKLQFPEKYHKKEFKKEKKNYSLKRRQATQGLIQAGQLRPNIRDATLRTGDLPIQVAQLGPQRVQLAQQAPLLAAQPLIQRIISSRLTRRQSRLHAADVTLDPHTLHSKVINLVPSIAELRLQIAPTTPEIKIKIFVKNQNTQETIQNSKNQPTPSNKKTTTNN